MIKNVFSKKRNFTVHFHFKEICPAYDEKDMIKEEICFTYSFDFTTKTYKLTLLIY